MSGPYMFGLGKGHLGDQARIIAERHGASLVNHTDPQCECGHGCRPFTCPKSARHWFETRDYGEPSNRATRDAVMADLEHEGARHG